MAPDNEPVTATFPGFGGSLLPGLRAHVSRAGARHHRRDSKSAPPKNDLAFVLPRPGFSHNRAPIRQDAWK